ncbi:5104_t:CDS:2 [Entrophospora sp. SA101]|nr:5104_t:CDS:2 [Entrophospora sp. SA101]
MSYKKNLIYDLIVTSFSSEPEVQYATEILLRSCKIDWLIGHENSTAELFIAALLEIYPKKVNYVLSLS